MKQLTTQGIVLNRTDFGEADRILTLLTPDHGKLRLMARGVRKIKSKLAGGIELFSITDITFIQGRGDIGTLISARLDKHYEHIVKRLDRVRLGYDLIKLLDKATEDHPGPEYFELLRQAFTALDNYLVREALIEPWFEAQLLRQAGYAPNLTHDTGGQPLAPGQNYGFDYEAMTFRPEPDGAFGDAHIKALRLLFGPHAPSALTRVRGLETTLEKLAPLLLNMRRQVYGF